MGSLIAEGAIETSFANRIAMAADTVPHSCLYRVNLTFLNSYLDCETLSAQRTWTGEPRRYYFLACGEYDDPQVRFDHTFKLRYKFIHSVSIICRECLVFKERTKGEVSASLDLLPDLVAIVIEYAYGKSESHASKRK